MAFAETLKTWRTRKRMSQMALASAAEVSPRHVSYLETGKASPSRPMVLRLADALSVPKHARNDWLVSAGFAPIYARRDLASDELGSFVKIVDRLLTRHDPFPGWALDASWTLIKANTCGETVLTHLGLKLGENLVEAMTADPTLGGHLINWEEAVAHLSHRLQGEGKTRMDAATTASAVKLTELSKRKGDGASTVAIPTVLQVGGLTLSLISIQALFNTAQDLTLADLRIELFYPIDQLTENNLETLLNAPPTS